MNYLVNLSVVFVLIFGLVFFGEEIDWGEFVK